MSGALKSIFAEVANIPAAVAYVPMRMLTAYKPALVLAAPVAGTAALAFTAVAAPALTAAAVPLYLVGRLLQSQDKTYPPLAHRLFKANF